MSRRRWTWYSIALFLFVVLGVSLYRPYWHRRQQLQHFETAVAALERQQIEQVADHVRALSKSPEFAPHVHLLRGGMLLRQGNAAAALDELRQTRPDGELRVPALLITGECLYRLGRLLEAERLLLQLAQEQSDNAEAHRWLGAIYYDLGAIDASIAELKQAVRLKPNDHRPHRLLGLIHYDVERYGEAITHYRRALALRPAAEQQDIVRELAQSLVHRRDYEGALDVLKQASPNAFVLSLESECYWSLGRPDRARETLKRARSLDSDERSSVLLDARMSIDGGQPEHAIELLRRILVNDSHDYESRYQLAIAYQRLGRSDEYEDQISLLKASKKLHEAFIKLSELANRRPRDADVRDRLAELCQRLGKTDLATMWKRAANACRETDRGTAPDR